MQKVKNPFFITFLGKTFVLTRDFLTLYIFFITFLGKWKILPMYNYRTFWGSSCIYCECFAIIVYSLSIIYGFSVSSFQYTIIWHTISPLFLFSIMRIYRRNTEFGTSNRYTMISPHHLMNSNKIKGFSWNRA